MVLHHLDNAIVSSTIIDIGKTLIVETSVSNPSRSFNKFGLSTKGVNIIISTAVFEVTKGVKIIISTVVFDKKTMQFHTKRMSLMGHRSILTYFNILMILFST